MEQGKLQSAHLTCTCAHCGRRQLWASFLKYPIWSIVLFVLGAILGIGALIRLGQFAFSPRQLIIPVMPIPLIVIAVHNLLVRLKLSRLDPQYLPKISYEVYKREDKQKWSCPPTIFISPAFWYNISGSITCLVFHETVFSGCNCFVNTDKKSNAAFFVWIIIKIWGPPKKNWMTVSITEYVMKGESWLHWRYWHLHFAVKGTAIRPIMMKCLVSFLWLHFRNTPLNWPGRLRSDLYMSGKASKLLAGRIF